MKHQNLVSYLQHLKRRKSWLNRSFLFVGTVLLLISRVIVDPSVQGILEGFAILLILLWFIMLWLFNHQEGRTGVSQWDELWFYAQAQGYIRTHDVVSMMQRCRSEYAKKIALESADPAHFCFDKKQRQQNLIFEAVFRSAGCPV